MIVNNVVPNKLHQELINAGVECSLFHNLEDGRYFVGECEIVFTEGANMGLVQQVIGNHDATPLQRENTQEDYLLDLDFRLSTLELRL